MAQDPRKRRKTDARRTGERGTGKLDTGGRAGARRGGARRAPTPKQARERLAREREEAIARLRELGVSPDVEEARPAPGTSMALDIGDVAQASERQDLAFVTRERVAARINRLTAALARLAEGRWGRCEVCGGPIEPERLAAMPEAETCLRCQAEQERRAGRVA